MPYYTHGRQFLSSYYHQTSQLVNQEIMGEDDKFIVGTDIDKLVEYYYHKYSLSTIEEDPNAELSMEHSKYLKTLSDEDDYYGHRRGGDVTFEYEKIKVEIPMLDNPTISKINDYSASTYSISYNPNQYTFLQRMIWFEFDIKGYGFSYEEDRIALECNKHLSNIRSIIQNKNNDINSGNIELHQSIRNFLLHRSEKLKQDSYKIEALSKLINIPLKKKEGSSITAIRVSIKPAITHIKPSPIEPEDYRLDESIVIEIAKVLEAQGSQFEKTPKSFKSLGEEDLRDILLVNLNSIFEGTATGETFSTSGKTDIYLRIDKGNILIFECKIWGGEKLYHETINQLRSYVNWRHNFGVMITFSRNRDFSAILGQVESILKSDTSYKNGFKKVSDTHYISKHSLGGDSEKEVQIHHLFFNLYSE